MKNGQAALEKHSVYTRPLKGQAALDFLMTYGWALILLVTVVGMLFLLGIFDISGFTGNRAAGFADVGAIGWGLAKDGQFGMQFENHAGKNIVIQNITATMSSTTILNNTNMTLGIGEKTNITTIGTFPGPIPQKGAGYTVVVEITYRELGNNWTYITKGTVTGKIGDKTW